MSIVLVAGCDVPAPQTAAAQPVTVAANSAVVHKKRHCVIETGSRLCRDPDEEVDGAALGMSGSPDIQQGRGGVNGASGLH